MSESPLARHASTPAELKERHDAPRASGGRSSLLRNAGGRPGPRCRSSRPVRRLTIGRREQNDVALPWDERVSRLHAELEYVGGDWVVVDDGLSTHGTWVGEHEFVGRRRLRDGDLIRVGQTLIAYCAPADTRGGTALGEDDGSAVQVTPAQRRVLVALCRPAARRVTPTPRRRPTRSSPVSCSSRSTRSRRTSRRCSRRSGSRTCRRARSERRWSIARCVWAS